MTLKRFRFKPDCVDWILQFNKRTTFRRFKHEGLYDVKRGKLFIDRTLASKEEYRAGLIVNLTPLEHTSIWDVLNHHYSTEGPFPSQIAFEDWLRRTKLLDKMPAEGWLHKTEPFCPRCGARWLPSHLTVGCGNCGWKVSWKGDFSSDFGDEPDPLAITIGTGGIIL